LQNTIEYLMHETKSITFMLQKLKITDRGHPDILNVPSSIYVYMIKNKQLLSETRTPDELLL
jgi:hypothetical protein